MPTMHNAPDSASAVGMRKGKAPAFQFYAADFLADENVALMTNQELGCYIKLICFCWREGSIPADVQKIAKLCGEDGIAMAELWVSISPCYAPTPDNPVRLVHPRLELERRKQADFKSQRSSAGKKGAEARWPKRKAQRETIKSQPDGDGSANGSAIKQRMATDGSSSSSSSSDSSVANATGGQPPEAPRLPPDPVKQEIWDAGRSLLEACRMPAKQAGSFLGKLVQDYTAPVVLDAVRAAVKEQPVDAAEYLKACCMRASGQRRSTRAQQHDAVIDGLLNVGNMNEPPRNNDFIDVEAVVVG
jgi:uncharacterized protein YdaU (DUF1376 family)